MKAEPRRLLGRTTHLRLSKIYNAKTAKHLIERLSLENFMIIFYFVLSLKSLAVLCWDMDEEWGAVVKVG